MASVNAPTALALQIMASSLIEGSGSKCLRAVLAVLLTLVPLQAGIAQPATESYRQLILAIQQRIDQNELQEARSMIVTAEITWPANAGLENLLGVVEIQQGHRDAALQQFSSAVRHDPALTGAYLNLGRIYSESAQTNATARTAALRVYQKLLVREPANGEANYQAAMLLMWNHNYQPSLDHLARLSSEDRNRVGALVIVCAAQTALHQQGAAEITAAALIAAPDFQEQDARQLLPVLREAHRADLIERLYAAANEKQPLSPDGLRILGLAQEAEGKLDVARQTLELAFSHSPSSVPLLVDLTRVAKAGKDYQSALGYLAHARDLDPGNAGFAYEFGVISLRMGLLGESRKAMAEAVRISPDNPEFNYALGIVASFAQDPTQGLPGLEKYHRLRPNDPAALLAIGALWFRASNYDSATLWLKQAAAHRSTAAEAHYYLGRIARVSGHLEDAKHELEQANLLTPERPDVLGELGQVYTTARDYRQAQALLDRAVALDPENYGANFGLLQLYARTADPRREEQAKHFEQIKARDEEGHQEMMRTIELRPENAPAS